MKKRKILMVTLPLVFLIHTLSIQVRAAKRLTWNSSSSWKPVIALDSSDNIHVVWYDYAAGDAEIYYKKSTNGGINWTTRRLTWTTNDAWKPAIAIDSNDNLHIVFYDVSTGNYEIYYKKGTENGANWMTKRLTWTAPGSENPDIAVDPNDDIHLVWEENAAGNSEIYYKKSTTGGSTWTGAKQLTANIGYSLFPKIAIDSHGDIHVAWRDGTPGFEEIYYMKSMDGGASWVEKRLTWAKSFCNQPDIAIDSSDNIYIGWTKNGNLYYKMSTDGGTSWTAKKLTWTHTASLAPAITFDPSNDDIHLVWQEALLTSNEIYHKKSTNGGANWTNTRLTWNTGQSYLPEIAVDSRNRFHVVWQDDTPGNDEIYYINK